MSGLFYQLGKLAGPKLRQAGWIFRSLTGSEAEAIQAEYQAGRDLAQALAGEVPSENEPTLVNAVQEWGARLADRVNNKHRRFTFSVLVSSDANAFALPGGFIFITRALLELCHSAPDEIAFVLGHEIGHVLRKHALDRMLVNSVIHTAVRAVPAAGLVRSHLGGLVVELLSKGYSQDQEFDADILGVRLARSAGFEPTAGMRLLSRLRDCSVEPSALGTYFSSHPPFSTRIQNLRRFLGTPGT